MIILGDFNSSVTNDIMLGYHLVTIFEGTTIVNTAIDEMTGRYYGFISTQEHGTIDNLIIYYGHNSLI